MKIKKVQVSDTTADAMQTAACYIQINNSNSFYTTNITYMEKEKRIDVVIRIATSIVTLITVIIGVWQFNKGQSQIKERDIEQRRFEMEKMDKQASIETITKFKEAQNKVFAETASVIAYLSVNKDVQSIKYQEKLERFWQLYWVELSAVETPEVEKAMKSFGDVLKDFQEKKFIGAEEHINDLQRFGYLVAQAMKNSAKKWSLPEDLQSK